MPRWAIDSDAAEGEYEKGIHFSTIQLSLTEGNFDADTSVTVEQLIAHWHDPISIASGHYQTSVHTIDNRWFHYDDGVIPTQGPLTAEDLKDITIV